MSKFQVNSNIFFGDSFIEACMWPVSIKRIAVLEKHYPTPVKLTLTYPKGENFHANNVVSLKVVRQKSGDHYVTYEAEVDKEAKTDYGVVVSKGTVTHHVKQHVAQVRVTYPKAETLREERVYNFVKEKQ